VDLDAGLQMVELVVARVPLEDLGADAFVGGQEPGLHLLPAQFCEHLIDLGDLSALHEAALEVGDAVAQEEHPVHSRIVVLLEVEDRFLDDLLELEFGLVRVLELALLLVLDELVRAEMRELARRVGEDGGHALVPLAVLHVHGEDHRLAP